MFSRERRWARLFPENVGFLSIERQKLNMYKVLSFSSVFAADSHKRSWNLSTLSAQLMQCNFCPTLKCHLPRYCWHLFSLLSLCIERILFKANLQKAVHLQSAGSSSAVANSYLMPTWCLVMKPMCSQGEEILSKSLNIPWTLIGRRCHRRWEAVGVTRQRESITRDGKACFHNVSVQSAILLPPCLWNSPSSAQLGSSFQLSFWWLP